MEEESAKGIRRWLQLAFRRLARVEKPQDLEREIQQIIGEGEEQGLISEDEGEMIQGIFSFRDTLAREIMIPRTDMVSVRFDATVRDVIQLILDSGHSRIPVYQDSVDNIIGILHAKDLLHCWGRDELQVRDMVRPPYFIPETKRVSDLLRDLRHRKSHMAIVIDEYGGTAGIITLEDIIEEIIGDIMDEYDSEEDWIVHQDDGSLLVDARLDVEELEDVLGIEFPEGKFESIGGFIISLLGRVPEAREQVVFRDLEMTVESADSRKIEKIRIRRPPPEPRPLASGNESAA